MVDTENLFKPTKVPPGAAEIKNGFSGTVKQLLGYLHKTLFRIRSEARCRAYRLALQPPFIPPLITSHPPLHSMTESDYGLLLLPDTSLAEPQATDPSGQEIGFCIAKGLATLYTNLSRAPDAL